jgi:6-phosphogluconolactonase
VTVSPGDRIAAGLDDGGPVPDVVVEPDADRLARAVASALVARLAAAQAVHGTATVVLTGGGIGTAVLERVAGLAAEPERERVDWTAVDVWWGDERFVPAGDEERNDVGARRALLDPVGVPAERVHGIPASDAGFAEPEDAAEWYAGRLAAAAPEGAALPRIDLLLLGMGEEGHVASIFPGSPAVDDDRLVVAVRDCPKPPPTRVSLGFPAINAAEEVWLLVSGAAKAPAVAAALRGADRRELPAAGVRGRRATRWLLDAAAAGELDPDAG